MKNELRYDRGTIEVTESADGFLRAKVVIARPGVFPYLTPSGDICYEAKIPEDLFSEITINSAKGAPVTDGHPPAADNGGMIDTSNWQKYIKGSLGDAISIENQMLEATETVFDADLISELKKGNKLEVSIGFRTRIDDTPGEYEGEKYDTRQTNIIINHIAHVESGRAGEDVRAYIDSADGLYAVQIEKQKVKKNKIKIRRDSKMDVAELIKKFLEFLGVKSDSEEEKKDNEPDEEKKDNEPDPDEEKKDNDVDSDEEKKDNDDDEEYEEKKTDSKDVKKLKRRLREVKARADAAEALAKKLRDTKKRQDEASVIDRAVKRRLSLINSAKSVINDFKYDGLSDRDIMLKVIGQALPFESEVKTDKLDDIYIKARFDAAMSLVKERANIYVGAGSKNRIDSAVIEEKRHKRLTMMEESK
jgi:hypothetical protein